MEISKYSKAIAGFTTVLVLGFLKQFGILPDMPVSDAINIVVAAVVTGAAIWAAPKNK